ncbi:PIN domain-containing protein [Aestuariivirga sp. YIM B02566]|uniref:PIN domain-containing protein n=1 Tax=Taklimakanibacter albus TaxID=2800327 RepID=A0ACC5R9Z2_9HYPH|nr:PIN domain-containing protein [Aestuariivirga sp. YIM B02566]
MAYRGLRRLPTADVTGYEPHIPQLTLPDPDDRHVLAAAIAAGASRIVTWNLADFPAAVLAPHNVVAQNPDDFLMGLYVAAPDVTIAVAANARRNLRRTTSAVADFIAALERQRLAHFSAVLSARADEL